MTSITLRPSEPGDEAALAALYAAAFPAEDLVPLVRALLREPDTVRSLVAVDDAGLVGHVMITRCGLEGRAEVVSLLGPLAVAPDHQRRGIGGRLVCAALEEAASMGATAMLVLGDPAYYGRFGFTAETKIQPPYPMPAEWVGAWQSVKLVSGAADVPRSRLAVPEPWRQPGLWSPPDAVEG